MRPLTCARATNLYKSLIVDSWYHAQYLLSTQYTRDWRYKYIYKCPERGCVYHSAKWFHTLWCVLGFLFVYRMAPSPSQFIPHPGRYRMERSLWLLRAWNEKKGSRAFAPALGTPFWHFERALYLSHLCVRVKFICIFESFEYNVKWNIGCYFGR